MNETATIRYRLARQSDEGAVALLHADSWRRTFRGLLPDRYLDEDITAERAETWRLRFAEPARAESTVTIVAEHVGELVGFVHSDIDNDPKWGALLDNLHVRHDMQGRGIAHRLMGETAEVLRERGRQRVHLTALEANERARRLYESLRGEIVETGVWEFAGATIPSYRYAWSELDPLLACLPQDRPPLK
jgi:ribosomal protein S18 acetylase RimI-like enzyme